MPSERSAGDRRDIVPSDTPVDALELVKSSVLDRPPKFEDLPPTIRIDSVLQPCAEAFDDFKNLEGDDLSLLGISKKLNHLHKQNGVEFGCAIIANHEGKLTFGPTIKGEEKSVNIGAPLHRIETTSPMGLTIYRDETIAAGIHTHHDETSFSLQDIYSQFFVNNGSVKQLYVVRDSGVIDMAHLTADSSLLSRERFDELVDLWSVYLDHNGMFNKKLSEREYNGFIRRILNETLKIGFYSNEKSDDPAILQREGLGEGV